MTFSQAQYQAVTDKINSGMAELSAKIQEVRPAAEAATEQWYMPDFVKDAVMDLVDEVVSAAEAVWRTIADLLKGVAAPVLFFFDAYDWQTVRGLASDVAGELAPNLLPSTQHWTGRAQQAYVNAVSPQSAAAARIGTISDSTADALNECALAGLGFYFTIGMIVVQYVITMVGVIAALGSIAFSWAGLGIAVGDTVVGMALISTAVVSLLTTLGLQAKLMVSLHGQTVDASTFPGGEWPEPATSSFHHAT
jgi:hypothetical protein